MKHYIYKITCLCDDYKDKFYIGCHTGKINDRYTGSGINIKEYFKKYDKIENETYKKEILEICNSREEATIREKYYLELYKDDINKLNIYIKSFGHGNLGNHYTLSEETKNKMRNYNRSDEHKKHISLSKLGQTHTEETKEKLRELNLGENNPMYGKHHSDETKAKMRQAAKIRWQKRKAA